MPSPSPRTILRAGALLLAALALYEAWTFYRVWRWVDRNPERTSFMELRLSQLRRESPEAELRQKWVRYGQIAPSLKRAVLAAEDIRFLRHDGFDWEGIEDALEKNLRSGRIVAGGSTVSQQLAKNLFLSDGRTPWRKAQEAVITLMLETTMSKRRILEIYLNVIEWGQGIFGAQAASNHYFGLAAAHLSPEQAARLAAMIPNPRYYDENRNARELNRRTRLILARMRHVRVP
ncbi:MAG: monofunctional biosynthetic peptidoglycan transglycosylase [Deltaproteobacteria bacterium]|nr:monofunctional biosynthetic peptidoglycan transglycosylase [Deltaproteobacteria bacterium]